MCRSFLLLYVLDESKVLPDWSNFAEKQNRSERRQVSSIAIGDLPHDGVAVAAAGGKSAAIATKAKRPSSAKTKTFEFELFFASLRVEQFDGRTGGRQKSSVGTKGKVRAIRTLRR